jgi:uncharacterized protein (TIGR02996 family)
VSRDSVELAPVLARAHAQLRADKPEDALAQMLQVWRQVRAPGLGEAIERLSRHLASSRPPPSGDKLADIDEEWRERAKRGDPAELGVLLPSLAELDSQRARKRLRVLADHAPDPRVALALCELLERPPYTASSTSKFWTKLVELLCRCADPRVVERLERGGGVVLGGHFGERLERMRARVSAAMRAELETLASELDPAAAARLEAIVTELDRIDADRPRTGEELLAAVLAEPDDLAHRQVYADFLLTEGDPRGEFITLQLADAAGSLDRAGRRRMRALLAEHGQAWLGGLAGGLVRSSLVFERGFLVAARVKASPRARASLAGAPSWATVEAVDNAPISVLVHPVMRALRRITCTPAQLEALLRQQVALAGVERVEIAIERGHSLVGLPEWLGRSEVLPGLRTVVLRGEVAPDFEDQAQLWSGALGRRLRTIVIAGFEEPPPPVGTYLRALRHAGATLDHLELDIGVGRFVLVGAAKSAGSPWSRVELHLDRERPDRLPPQLDSLEGLGDLELVASGRGLARVRDRHLLARLDRLGSLTKSS